MHVKLESFELRLLLELVVLLQVGAALIVGDPVGLDTQPSKLLLDEEDLDDLELVLVVVVVYRTGGHVGANESVGANVGANVGENVGANEVVGDPVPV